MLYYMRSRGWSQSGAVRGARSRAAEAQLAAHRRASQPTTNPYRGNAAAIAEGQQVFTTICAACHKPDGTRPGRARASSIRTGSTATTDADLFVTVTKGRPGGMPPWGAQLGTEKIWKALAYLETLPKSQRAGPRRARLTRRAPAHPPAPAAPSRGATPCSTRAPSRAASGACARGANAILIAILFAVPVDRDRAASRSCCSTCRSGKFHVFGLVIFPQELFFLWLIVAGLALALFFFTALAGRLWCGWACPQTVFTDLFARLARRIQGWRGSGRAARASPAGGASRRTLAWVAALARSIGFHLVGYFRSPYELLARAAARDVRRGAQLGFLAAAPRSRYLDFAIVRQTFCKYLCPYARFQGVLFDSRHARGRLRRAARRAARQARRPATGDCVDCGLCVAVCPTRHRHPQGPAARVHRAARSASTRATA